MKNLNKACLYLPSTFAARAGKLTGKLSLAVALAITSSFVQAQGSAIETIVVTADRQATRIGDLSSSVFVVGEEVVQLVDAVHISELLVRVPGTWISRNNGQESLISIRSPVLTGAGSCGAFQTSQDGIPLRAAGFCNVNQLFEANTEQAGAVEVILGPGSVLYGANAIHGAINVLTEGVSDDFSGFGFSFFRSSSL